MEFWMRIANVGVTICVGILVWWYGKKQLRKSILQGLQSTHRQIRTATGHLQVYLEGKIRKVPTALEILLEKEGVTPATINTALLTLVTGMDETLDPICKQLQTAHESLRDYIRGYNPRYEIHPQAEEKESEKQA